jgi:parvulin-like peptidyl-prolyl isomerase
MPKKTIAALTVLSFAAGVALSEVVYRSEVCRDAIGQFCGRGRLLTLVNRKGIYEIDVKREIDADCYAAGQISNCTVDPNIKPAIVARLIANENLRQVSRSEPDAQAEFMRQFEFFEFEFGDEKLWAKRMRDSGISKNRLRTWLRDDLRMRSWIDHHSLNVAAVEENAGHEFYAAHRASFVRPPRFRASHLFLAAPPETPEETVRAKQEQIELLGKRISDGEQFAQLVSEASEDEANKLKGGDLGYFSSWRMPSDFFVAVSQLHTGEVSKPFRSRLGFHIVQLLEVKPAHELTFEEARPEIIYLLANQRRQDAVDALEARMSRSSALHEGWF